jgi:hypothetical protein
MEKIVDELLAQRKLMPDHMRKMMDGRMSGRDAAAPGASCSPTGPMDHSQHE